MTNFNDIIKMAMQHEDKEAEFYESLARRSRSQDQKNALLAHAEEEREHKRHLENILEKGTIPSLPNITPDADMKLAELLVVSEKKEDSNIDFEEALLMATKREKAAEQFYRTLAKNADDAEVAKVFSFLADQESKHAIKLEQEYDDGQQE
ncbi:MAG: ferritin family protein [Magnetococcales bacterium]|nr:ferritin family protein [Magnetococcales bacterium]